MLKIAAFPALKILLMVFALSIASLNAEAALTSYTSNSAELVYSSISNVTWTENANLLGSLIAASGDANNNSTNDVIDAIIAASPTITNSPNIYSPLGSYAVSASDFSSDGTTNWFGAMAFIKYLNNTNYGGSTNWRLPTVIDSSPSGCDFANSGGDCGYNIATNGTASGVESAELYYSELGSKGYYDANGIPESNYGITDSNNQFDNEERFKYWSGSEYEPNVELAWFFDHDEGNQDASNKLSLYYVWAVSAGQIDCQVAAVPEPSTYAMMAIGLITLIGMSRRRI